MLVRKVGHVSIQLIPIFCGWFEGRLNQKVELQTITLKKKITLFLDLF